MWLQTETEIKFRSQRILKQIVRGVRKTPGEVMGDGRHSGRGEGSSEWQVTNSSAVNKGKYRTDHWIWPGAGPLGP